MSLIPGINNEVRHIYPWNRVITPFRNRPQKYKKLKQIDKDNMNIKHKIYFFESPFEDLSFHSFLKASDWDFEEKLKNICNTVNIVLILIVLEAQIPSGKRWK